MNKEDSEIIEEKFGTVKVKDEKELYLLLIKVI